MTRAFIITYRISGNTDLRAIADELYEELVGQGHDIESVKVYKEKSGASLRPVVPAALPAPGPS